MVRSALFLMFLAAVTAACNGGGDKKAASDPTRSGGATAAATRASGDAGGDLAQFEGELRTTFVAAVKETLGGSVVTAYDYLAASYKEKCSLDDYLGLMAFARIFIGDLKDSDVSAEVTSIRYDGSRAYVESKLALNGNALSDTEVNGDSNYWVREGGAWKMGTDEPEPCDSGGSLSDTSKTPKAEGPGTTRDQAVPIGTAVRSGDLEVKVVRVNADAAAVIARESEFPSTPEADRRFVLVRVSVRHAGTGEDTVDASGSNFAITGSGKVLYEPYDAKASCGFDVPDELQAELFAGGTAEGNVCIQIPRSESGLILVVKPQFSFGSDDRRFLSLE